MNLLLNWLILQGKKNNRVVPTWFQSLSKNARATGIKTMDSKILCALAAEKKLFKKKKKKKSAYYKSMDHFLCAIFYSVSPAGTLLKSQNNSALVETEIQNGIKNS